MNTPKKSNKTAAAAHHIIKPTFDLQDSLQESTNNKSSLPFVPPPRPNSQEMAKRSLTRSPHHQKNHHKQNLPTQFKCHGQFCKLHTVDPDALQSEGEEKGSNRERAMVIAKQVLSSSELRNLEESGKLLQLGVTKRDPLAFMSVSQRSIIQACEENRLIIGDSHDESESWRKYPEGAFPKSIVPTADDNRGQILRDDESSSPSTLNAESFSDEKRKHRHDVRRGKSLTAQTMTSKGRATWGEAHGEVQGGAANYYKEVKVCGVCAQVYSLLDQSRELVHLEEEKKMDDERVKRRSDYLDQRDYKVDRKHNVVGHHSHDGNVMGEEAVDSGVMSTELGRQLFGASVHNPLDMLSIAEEELEEPTTFLSPGKPRASDKQKNPLRSPSLPKPRATWKSHLEKEEEEAVNGKTPKGKGSKSKSKRGQSSSQQALAKGNDPHFEVLDDYLHGQKKYQNTVDSRKKAQLHDGHADQQR